MCVRAAVTLGLLGESTWGSKLGLVVTFVALASLAVCVLVYDRVCVRLHLQHVLKCN